MALTDKLKAIADAIRGKTGKTEAMTLDQMPEEIAGIETGGGEEEVFFATFSSAMYFKRMDVTGDCQNINNSMYKNALHLEEYYAPNSVLDKVNAVGQEAFSGCSALRIVYLPKATYFMHYNFRYCTGLSDVQLGSVGYPVTVMALYTFNGVTQGNLTITLYVDADTLADIPDAVTSSAPWGATNATIIYRNSTTGEVITE